MRNRSWNGKIKFLFKFPLNLVKYFNNKTMLSIESSSTKFDLIKIIWLENQFELKPKKLFLVSSATWWWTLFKKRICWCWHQNNICKYSRVLIKQLIYSNQVLTMFRNLIKIILAFKVQCYTPWIARGNCWNQMLYNKVVVAFKFVSKVPKSSQPTRQEISSSSSKW